MKLALLSTVTALSLTFGATSASAHHAAGAYDKNHLITAKVVLEKFVWENPHVEFFFDAKNSDGSVTRWLLEAGPPITFLRGGYKASDFNKGVGTPVTMSWCPTKTGLSQDGIMLGMWHSTGFVDGSRISDDGVKKVPPPDPGKCN